MNKIVFTSESVSEGHPDKVADQIADAILGECLKKDSQAHVACEVFCTGNNIIIGGEITCKSPVNYKRIAKKVLKDIGYDKDELGTNYHNVKVKCFIKEQSQDINQGVSRGSLLDTGAGDQGMMFGYATNETKTYMPLPISIAHDLVKEATAQRKKGSFLHARPDMKSQVSIDYSDKNDVKIDNILMSIQHDPNINIDDFKKYIHDNIMIKIARKYNLNEDFNYEINPTGNFVIGGPQGDTGLTGRKIIVDTYGGSAHHGGGAFSGKDPTKVDRSGAYLARYIAKNLVAAGVADKLEIQISYAIGIAQPTSIFVNTFNTSKYSDEIILNIIKKIFDLRPGGIIAHFSLDKPTFKYRDTTNYGHFGKEKLPWERLDKVKEIKQML